MERKRDQILKSKKKVVLSNGVISGFIEEFILNSILRKY